MTTPQLVLLNGIPGSGKSTMAQAWAQRRSRALVIDIDLVRASLPRWQDDPMAAGLLAREITLAMAGEQLRAGGEVIIPQYLGRPEFLDQLSALATNIQAALHEVALRPDLAQASRRFTQRPTDTAHAAHAAAEVAAGGPDELDRMAERLLAVIEQRPNTMIINSTDDLAHDVDALDAITGAAQQGPRAQLIVLAGLPGTGKTTLGHGLVRTLGGSLLRVDAVENALLRGGTPVGPLGYEICHVVAAHMLGVGGTVVIDAVNPVPEARQGWVQLAHEHNVTIAVLETVLDNDHEHRRRIESRREDLPDQLLPTWSEVQNGGYAPWDESRDGLRVMINTTDSAEALRLATDAVIAAGA